MSGSDGVVLRPLRIHLVPDTAGQERIPKWNPDTGERRLVNPATEGNDHEPWPLKGAQFCDAQLQPVDPPTDTSLPQSYARAHPEFIELVNAKPKVVPAGPPDNPYSKDAHVFVQCDAIVFHMLDGDHRYRVTKNPGKYDTETDAEVDSPADPTTYITWEYQLELEG